MPYKFEIATPATSRPERMRITISGEFDWVAGCAGITENNKIRFAFNPTRGDKSVPAYKVVCISSNEKRTYYAIQEDFTFAEIPERRAVDLVKELMGNVFATMPVIRKKDGQIVQVL